MSAVFRAGIANLASGKSLILNVVAKQLPATQQSCKISSKGIRDLNGVKRPPPYDYKGKGYSLWNQVFDTTLHRMDENSTVILVEGPIASGKSAFAKELAKDLDMLYVPEANMDLLYINDYGVDFRTFDSKLPPNCRTFDTNNFLKDPKNRWVANYQYHMFGIRYQQYIEALAHLFSTGQGVVLDRSIYSDKVFADTLFQSEYISRNFHKAYYELRLNCLPALLKPHLVIYLDVPVPQVKQNIKKRNNPIEAASPVFKTDKFLNDMERNYKQDFLKEVSEHAELLVYDWSNGGEVELVIEDIERIDFERFEKHDKKIHDWRFLPTEGDWCEARRNYTEEKWELLNLLDMPMTHVPEMMLTPDESKVLDEVMLESPGNKYAFGYNASQGDNVGWFKTKEQVGKWYIGT